MKRPELSGWLVEALKRKSPLWAARYVKNAKECGANFTNVSLSPIFCMWTGESEHNVEALFTSAAKIAPTVLFVYEIHSLLGRRTSNKYDTEYRKVENEFTSLRDGLRTKAGKQIFVLGATNRPFDLDEAIIGRFERRWALIYCKPIPFWCKF